MPRTRFDDVVKSTDGGLQKRKSSSRSHRLGLFDRHLENFAAHIDATRPEPLRVDAGIKPRGAHAWRQQLAHRHDFEAS
jgi:hypothetical protein